MITVNVKINDPRTQRTLTLATATYDAERFNETSLLETFPAVEGFTAFFVEITTAAGTLSRPICGLDFAEKFGRPLDAFIALGRDRDQINQTHGAQRVTAMLQAITCQQTQ